MSTEAVTWVKNLDFDACAIGPFRVLLILAEHANTEGKRSWRSKRKIAVTLGVSERSVQRWYKELIAAGLIVPGDQAYVAHIPANQRPVVYNLCMTRSTALRAAELPEYLGETGLSTELLGETTAVAVGETTAVVSRNQILKPLNSSIKASHSSRALTCSHGHPIIDISGGGVPLCMFGCEPADTSTLAGARS